MKFLLAPLQLYCAILTIASFHRTLDTNVDVANATIVDAFAEVVVTKCAFAERASPQIREQAIVVPACVAHEDVASETRLGVVASGSEFALCRCEQLGLLNDESILREAYKSAQHRP